MANKTLSDFPVLTNLDAASVAHVQKELVDYQVPLDTLTQYVTENAEYTALGAKIDGATEKTTPVDADMVGLMDSAASKILKKLSWSNIKATLKTYFDTLYLSYLNYDGWIPSAQTWTYASADAPTFTMTAPGDLTGIYKAGMKVKLTQTTVKFFFISIDPTYSAGTGLTTFTLYGGTDYTLDNAAITSPYYSREKAPFGFPMSPAKWTVEVTDASLRSQTSATSNVWYNLGSIVISIPIGLWTVSYRVFFSTNAAAAYSQATLSTANNSESDADFTTAGYSGWMMGYSSKVLATLTKTSYYLNTRSVDSGANIYNINSNSKLIIRAVCAYL